MPSLQTQTATLPGAVAPPVNSPCTVSASGSVSIGGAGYLIVLITDSISGQIVCGIADMVRPSEMLSGTKNFSINASSFFSQAANLQVSVATRPLDGASIAPTVSNASLTAFSASATAQQGTV
jgi:hypothetical protein